MRDRDTVIRPAGPWTPAIHRLLGHLRAAGVGGVPRALGRTEDGREVLSFLEGTVPAYPMPQWVWSPGALVSSARLLRRLHDATVDADRAGPWRSPTHQPVEVVCHNDFAPYNLVFAGHEAVGVIDWDFASPGPRLWDLCYLAYRIVPLSGTDRRDGLTGHERRRRLRRLMRAYGSDAGPRDLLGLLGPRLQELAAFSDRAAHELGKPELARHAELYRRDARDLEARWLDTAGPEGP